MSGRSDRYDVGEPRYGLITSFTDDHDFLSNFYLSPITVRSLTFPSVEHAFQAAKVQRGDEATRALIISACKADGTPSPSHAKRLGARVKLRPDWEDIKVNVMRALLRVKFDQASDLGTRLLLTGGKHLVEGNDWNDTFWGCVQVGNTWVGANMLGILLMERRKELQNDIPY